MNFLEQIKLEKENAIKSYTEEYSNSHTEADWNGNSIEIVEKNDIYLYISENKDTIKVTIGEFDPRISFSNLIYFCHVDYVGKYINSGLQFIGFYDSDYCKVSDIEFSSFKIIDCNVGWSFEG